MSVPQLGRVLLKLSGEALLGEAKFGIDPQILERIAVEIRGVVQAGVQVGVVIGGGNIFRGVAASAKGMDRAMGDSMGMLATVINCLALSDSLRRNGVENRVMTALEMKQLAEPYIRLRAVRHLSRNLVTLFAGGTGSPYFTTDTAAALRAAEIQADALFKATKVDGVYDSDPRKNKDAKLYDRVSYDTVLDKHLDVMDATAVSLCRENRMPIVVFNMLVHGNIQKALTGVRMGTVIEEMPR